MASLNYNWIFFATTLVALAVLSAVQAGAEPDTQKAVSSSSCDETIVKLTTRQCRSFAKIKSLDEFWEFYENFEHLTNSCLRIKSVVKEPSKSSQLAEEECKHNGLLFYQVRHLALLVHRWLSPNELVCTMEFTMKLYHLHQQLHEDGNLSRMLRLLANSVAWKCRSSLVARLKNIQNRAPEVQQWNKLIVGLINLGGDYNIVSRLKPLDRVELYVPILERQLPERIFGSDASNSLARDGFELKSANSLRLSFDSLRMACNTLKPYQVNVLGSLGLLASLGYASPAGARLVQLEPKLKAQEESRQDGELVQQWLLASLLCQSVRSVLKMQVASGEGKNLYRFKIVATQEADVTLDDEQDTTFASFRLPETLSGDILEASKSSLKFIDLLSQFNLSPSVASKRLNARTLHLINGPNYKLSNAIGTYLDMSKKSNRLEAVEEVLGMKLEFDEMTASNEDEEEEEEEEE